MHETNRYPGLDPALLKQVNYHAQLLKRMPCFAKETLADLQQELLCEAWLCLKKYDPKRSTLSTFMNRVLQRHLKYMLRRQITLRKGKHKHIVSLDQNNHDDLSLSTRLIDQHGQDSFADYEHDFDIDWAIAHLPLKKRGLCDQLRTLTITEVAHLQGRSRAAIYRELKHLQPAEVRSLL